MKGLFLLIPTLFSTFVFWKLSHVIAILSPCLIVTGITLTLNFFSHNFPPKSKYAFEKVVHVGGLEGYTEAESKDVAVLHIIMMSK